LLSEPRTYPVVIRAILRVYRLTVVLPKNKFFIKIHEPVVLIYNRDSFFGKKSNNQLYNCWFFTDSFHELCWFFEVLEITKNLRFF
jgi:hypothetical protein